MDSTDRIENPECIVHDRERMARLPITLLRTMAFYSALQGLAEPAGDAVALDDPSTRLLFQREIFSPKHELRGPTGSAERDSAQEVDLLSCAERRHRPAARMIVLGRRCVAVICCGTWVPAAAVDPTLRVTLFCCARFPASPYGSALRSIASRCSAAAIDHTTLSSLHATSRRVVGSLL